MGSASGSVSGMGGRAMVVRRFFTLIRHGGGMSQKASPLSTARQQLDAGTERRLQRRKKAFRPSVIADANGERRVHLLDLTTEGALGYTFHPPATGETLTLLLLHHRVEAQVIWMEDRKFGLHFRTPISSTLVDQLLVVD